MLSKGIDVERLNGTFLIDGPLYKGLLFSGHLADGTQFHVLCKDLESVGAVLDAIQWEGEVDVDKIKEAVIGSADPKVLRHYAGEDDIPF